MVSSITINIAVGDITRSTRLLESLGFEVDPMFAAEPDMELVKLSSTVYVMLNSESRFESISRKGLVDTSRQAEAVLQLRVDSRKSVDDIVDAALSAGCTAIHPPNDVEPIYGRSFQDLDGHNWDFFCVQAAR